MATILLQAAGSALGGLLGPLGGVIGGAAGALAGRAIDQAIFGQKTISAPTLDGASISSADEGSPITRIYGTMRVGGNIIWATRFEEDITTERRGGKSTLGKGQKVETRNYYANFAVGLCEGGISQIKRIWTDGKELDLSQVEMRVYRGTHDQLPDPLIEAKQGVGNAPAYRGLAYVVFDRLPINMFGKRIPVLQFEVTRVIGALENKIEAVTLIPGATEHGLAIGQISEQPNAGEQRILNHNVSFANTDLKASLDGLQALCPNLKSIGLVVSWFGTDLRADHCQFMPGVEVSNRAGETRNWRVGSTARSNAYVVSQTNGKPNYGGTPDDASVIEAIIEIKTRGLSVTIYPFILMDITAENTLPSPYDSGFQNTFPWRGRITCNPAIGEVGSADQTATATVQINALMGTSQISDFSINGTSVSSANGDNGYRRMILHYAHLVKAASNAGAVVDGFVIGSEMVALNRVRDDQNRFPCVAALVDLAADVASVLGANTKLTYAADWSEYFGYHPQDASGQDGSGDVYFHLDDLWASPAIDSVGIDNYMPLSDWRNDDLNKANPDGFDSPSDIAALQSQITSGEGYDYYYANSQDRKSRIRTQITDGLGKPWVFRFKDLKSWWENPHYNRVNGIEAATPTAWVPQSKPIWLTEFGCPAVDKGANQPNVFPDPKSSENAFPYFSNGARDDQIQRSFLLAHLNHWKSNANSSGMVDPKHCYIWTWDARPYPAFPQNTAVWSDGENWQKGHWINGRLGNAPLGELIAAILSDHGFYDFDVSSVEGTVSGYFQADITSARALLEQLLVLYQINVREGQDKLIFSSKMLASKSPSLIDAVIDDKDQQIMAHRRIQESELANEVQINHLAPELEYQPATAYSRRLSRGSQRQERLSLPGSLDRETAAQIADTWLQDHWASRQIIEFALPMSDIILEPGDRVAFANDALGSVPKGSYTIISIEDGLRRQVTAKRIIASTSISQDIAPILRNTPDVSAGFSPNVVLLDLPILSGSNSANWARAAAFVKPWVPMSMASSAGDSGYVARATIATPAYIGQLVEPLSKGPEGRIDYQNKMIVDLNFGEFETIAKSQILAGKNILAVQSNSETYEIIQFQNAEEIAPNKWQLSSLLRAQAGTDDGMRAGADSGAAVIFINDAVTNLGLNSNEMDVALNWRVDGFGKSSDHLTPIQFAGGERANTPLSPVHLRGKRQSDGVLLSWVRRGRYNADSWAGSDIPMDEDQLQFRVKLYHNNAVIYEVLVSDTQYLYPNAQELSDFGQIQSELRFSVQQIGGQISQGVVNSANITL